MRADPTPARLRVAALALRDSAILLAKHRKNERLSFLLPGGGVENGESVKAALARELREEARVECVVGALRYVIEVQAPALSRHIVQFVFETKLSGDVGPSRDPRVLECAWHPIEELAGLRMHPDVGALLASDLRAGRRAPRYVLARWRA